MSDLEHCSEDGRWHFLQFARHLSEPSHYVARAAVNTTGRISGWATVA
jgi:hypothetical protein